jgi:catechol 2,3-dioxygenase-like lactoylglutathione lyase family enzyme
VSKGYIQTVHPVLPVRDVVASLRYYVDKLGFEIAFADDQHNPMYAGITRDGIEIHLQWHDSANRSKMSASSLRFVIKDIDALYEEYKTQDVFHKNTSLKETSWGTREFAFYDPDMNGLTFCVGV